jgi:hypothetical protein
MNRRSNPALAAFGVLGAIAVGWQIVSFTLMITVGVVHSWWPLIPTMPYTVALAIGAVKTAATCIGSFLGEALKADR